MAAYEVYDDPGLPIAVADYNDTILSIDSAGAVTVHQGHKRQRIYRSVDGVSSSRINFSGTSTLWFFAINRAALSQADAGTVMRFWTEYGNGCENTFKFSHADGHTYVVYFGIEDYVEQWRKRTYATSQILHVAGKISD